MCRNIQTLYHVTPPATQEEIRLAALQFVRKVSGFRQPSRTNEAAFMAAVDDITSACITLLDALETRAPARPRIPLSQADSSHSSPS